MIDLSQCLEARHGDGKVSIARGIDLVRRGIMPTCNPVRSQYGPWPGTIEVANEGLHLQVDGDASLVAVNGEEQDALPVHHLVILPTPAALPRTAERLDGDNIGAEVGEGLNPHGPEQEVSETDDSNALEKVNHDSPHCQQEICTGAEYREVRLSCQRLISLIMFTENARMLRHEGQGSLLERLYAREQAGKGMLILRQVTGIYPDI